MSQTLLLSVMIVFEPNIFWMFSHKLPTVILKISHLNLKKKKKIEISTDKAPYGSENFQMLFWMFHSTVLTKVAYWYFEI